MREEGSDVSTGAGFVCTLPAGQATPAGRKAHANFVWASG